MKWSWRKLITAVVVLAVIYVFISPYFALDPSANRAWRAALQLMLSIAFLTNLVFGVQYASFQIQLNPEELKPRGSTDATLLSCISLC